MTGRCIHLRPYLRRRIFMLCTYMFKICPNRIPPGEAWFIWNFSFIVKSMQNLFRSSPRGLHELHRIKLTSFIDCCFQRVLSCGCSGVNAVVFVHIRRCNFQTWSIAEKNYSPPV